VDQRHPLAQHRFQLPRPAHVPGHLLAVELIVDQRAPVDGSVPGTLLAGAATPLFLALDFFRLAQRPRGGEVDPGLAGRARLGDGGAESQREKGDEQQDGQQTEMRESHYMAIGTPAAWL
jgi:hypothetical protein